MGRRWLSRCCPTRLPPYRAGCRAKAHACRTAQRKRAPHTAVVRVRNERAGGGDEGVVRGPGEVEATVAVGAVGSLVQGEGDVDDPVGELQNARVVGQQLQFGQGLTPTAVRASNATVFAASCSASDALASRSMERSFCRRRIAASRAKNRTTTTRNSPRAA
jgi:hypothetical protein